MPEPAIAIVGAGLSGATAAWCLRQAGLRVTVFERNVHVAGHIRNEWFHGIPYEPNGAHIFHTSDEEVWRLASSLVEFAPYEHRVKTRVHGRVLNWPIQMGDLKDLDEWPQIGRELAARPDHPDPRNFRSWCTSIMGETLYELYIAGYTEKQWGRDPALLSAEFAPKRVELRDDGYLGLFRDHHEGWPRQGYSALVEALLGDVEIVLSSPIDAATLPDAVSPGQPVIVTSPLDDFFADAEGPLEWRGVRLVPKYHPDVTLFQEASVVNEPELNVPYTRTIETKWVFPEMHSTPGTVVCYEYPGARTKHYPVYDAQGVNKKRQQRYLDRLAAFERNPLFAAGRLANYLYINMDQAMRQGFDAAAEVLRYLHR